MVSRAMCFLVPFTASGSGMHVASRVDMEGRGRDCFVSAEALRRGLKGAVAALIGIISRQIAAHMRPSPSPVARRPSPAASRHGETGWREKASCQPAACLIGPLVSARRARSNVAADEALVFAILSAICEQLVRGN